MKRPPKTPIPADYPGERPSDHFTAILCDRKKTNGKPCMRLLAEVFPFGSRLVLTYPEGTADIASERISSLLARSEQAGREDLVPGKVWPRQPIPQAGQEIYDPLAPDTGWQIYEDIDLVKQKASLALPNCRRYFTSAHVLSPQEVLLVFCSCQARAGNHLLLSAALLSADLLFARCRAGARSKELLSKLESNTVQLEVSLLGLIQLWQTDPVEDPLQHQSN